MKLFRLALTLALVSLGPALTSADPQVRPKIKLGYAKCAHCTPLTLVPAMAKDADIETIGFTTGNDVMTALLSKSIDVGQVTYLHLATALDRGFDLIAVSGQVNGGSQILAANDLPVKRGDWAGLKVLALQRRSEGRPLKIAASRGNAQDIQMRGAFAEAGLDVTKDLAFVNIPNPADHAQALRRGEVDLICSVEPFATQIRQVGAGKLFDTPYDQPAGKLTNLMLTRPDVIASNRAGVQATVDAIVKVDDEIAAHPDVWVGVITKVTGLDKAIAGDAIKNLQPDYKMYRPQALAIAAMMRSIHYISKDVSADIEKHMDYSFLETVTGKPKTDLGY